MSCVYFQQALKVFEVGFGEGLFSPSFLFGRKEKKAKEKPRSALRRGGLLSSSVSCAHFLHAREVFEVGFGEGLFSKSPSPIKESGEKSFPNNKVEEKRK
jgi:hypothetical protein